MCILLATDLTKHLIDRVEHFKTLKKFMKKRKEHRRVFLSLIMTASDMCETIKPWNDYIMTVVSQLARLISQFGS